MQFSVVSCWWGISVFYACSVGVVCDHVRTVENGSFSHLHNDSRPYYNRLGMAEMARTHFTRAGNVDQSDPAE